MSLVSTAREKDKVPMQNMFCRLENILKQPQTEKNRQSNRAAMQSASERPKSMAFNYSPYACCTEKYFNNVMFAERILPPKILTQQGEHFSRSLSFLACSLPRIDLNLALLLRCLLFKPR